ncbi:MAG: hypothetical protein AUH82_01125 [Chloroflexi bacterium 13_1_40CM_4_65_13]|nr:MAG: hypothetical protein AUH82_01125 [Chloroflexi bacterium 13_1_40CM_4_65_13]
MEPLVVSYVLLAALAFVTARKRSGTTDPRDRASSRLLAVTHVVGTIITDGSADGLRLSGLPFFLNVGEDLSIEMVGMPRAHSDLGKGRVVWSRAQEAGIHFGGRGSRNPSLVKLVEQAAALRSAAIEFPHPDSCACRNGERPLEPELPSGEKR